MSKTVAYYYKETDNSVYYSASGGNSASMALDIAAIKNPDASFNASLNARIVGLGSPISYVTQEGFTIPVSSSEELWVYRGYQPLGTGDADAYFYNPYMHRPYKLYSIVATQSGVPSAPFLPSGTALYGTEDNFIGQDTYADPSNAGGRPEIQLNNNLPNQPQQLNGMYDAGVLATLGNPTTESYGTASVSGTFEIINENRNVSPFVWTRYVGGNFAPPGFGAIFQITASSGFYSGSVWTISQIQQGILNSEPFNLDSVDLTNGTYCYTSSGFDATGVNNNEAFGSTVFGLSANYSSWLGYVANNDSTSTTNLKVFYTASNLTSSFFTIPAGNEAKFIALANTVSSSGVSAVPNPLLSSVVLDPNNPNRNLPTPPNRFAYKVQDVYSSFSSSLSQSIDGIYVFNQVPSTAIQLTASVRVGPWTGSSPGSKFGVSGSLGVYSNSLTGSAVYGPGETGGGNTWQTASIRVYKGNFPDYVPAVDITGSLIPTNPANQTFLITESNFLVNQGSDTQYTMSYNLSESITLKDCISMAISVSSGSAASTTVQNALFVKDYYLEFDNTPIVTGDGLVPVDLEGMFSGALPFNYAIDCQPFYANVANDRRQEVYFDADYSYGIYQPINFDLIISRSALYAEIPYSNYTTARIINPRYDGSTSTANSINSIEGLNGGFGTLPVIEYKTAFFAYANEVTDPYPLVNGVTQASLKYLIDESGKASQPNLSDWSGYDVEGAFLPEEGQNQSIARANISINPQEQQTQYLDLQGMQELFKVAERPIPILYSQTASDGYATFLPMGGNPNTVTNYVATFTNYYFQAEGPITDQETNDKIISYTASPGVVAGQPLQYVTASGGGTPTEMVLQIIDGIIPPNNIPTTNPGVLKFETDTRAAGNNLSDDWQISQRLTQPMTPPRTYRSKGSSFFKKSQYDNNIGSYTLSLDRGTTAGSIGNLSSVPLILNSIIAKIFFDIAGTNYEIINLVQVLGNTRAGLRNSNREIFIEWYAPAIKDYVEGTLGKDYDQAKYMTFTIDVRSNTILRSNEFYKWKVNGALDAENVDAKKNFYNPIVASPLNSGQTLNPRPLPTSQIGLIGSQQGQSDVDNALNVPYWDYPSSPTTSNNLVVTNSTLLVLATVNNAIKPGMIVTGGTSTGDAVINSISADGFTLTLSEVQTIAANSSLTYSTEAIIELQSSNGNALYGNSFQKTIPYSASDSTFFPGNKEPFDTTWPQQREPFNIEVGDEIRFENTERKYYTIIEVIAPQNNQPAGKLRLVCDRKIDPSINKDFFLIRRYVRDTSILLINSEFPYPGTPGPTQKFVINTGTYSGSDFQPATGSYVNVPSEPLSKKQLTTSAIIFPEYPTAGIQNEPDVIIEQLRNNKLID
tara:strand:+ start:1985 stop:6103 length:4119 start_codon:yes stop_codon:yes gene_type:complete